MSIKQKTPEIILPPEYFKEALDEVQSAPLEDKYRVAGEMSLFLASLSADEDDIPTEFTEELDRRSEGLKGIDHIISELNLGINPRPEGPVRGSDLIYLALLNKGGVDIAEEAGGAVGLRRRKEAGPAEIAGQQLLAHFGKYKSADDRYENNGQKIALFKKNAILSIAVKLMREMAPSSRDGVLDEFIKGAPKHFSKPWADKARRSSVIGSLSAFLRGASREVVGGDILDSISGELSELTGEQWRVEPTSVEEDVKGGADYILAVGSGDSLRRHLIDIKGKKPARPKEILEDVRKYSAIKKGSVIVLYVNGVSGDNGVTEKRKVTISRSKKDPAEAEIISCDTANMTETDDYRMMSDEIIQRIMTKEALSIAR
jgi:hypothetical protein